MLERLRFSRDILSRLGEELVPEVDQGIVELSKNAYDADATERRISLKDVHALGGSIRIVDDGGHVCGQYPARLARYRKVQQASRVADDEIRAYTRRGQGTGPAGSTQAG